MNRWLWQYCAGALLLCIGLALSQPGSAAAQAESLPPGLVAFGHGLAERLNRGEDVAVLLVAQPITCPQIGVDGIIHLCQGVPVGTVVFGCLAARLGAEAGVEECALLGPKLANIRNSEFLGRELALFTVSPDGRAAHWAACSECVTAIYSTPVDARSTEIESPKVLELQLIVVDGEWRIYSYAIGPVQGEGASAVPYGGTFEGRTYVPVPPAAPNAGTGLRSADIVSNVWMVSALFGALLTFAGTVGFLVIRRPAPSEV